MIFMPFILGFLALCACLVAGAFTWGFLEHYFARRTPFRVTTSSHRRLRWLADEIKKELEKAKIE